MFGKLATDQNFTNRKAEIVKLKQNFISGINTILISSLVRVCNADVWLFNDNTIRVTNADEN